ILNSPTKLMKSEGYGSGYEYDHDAPDAFSGQDYFPEALGRQTFYGPRVRGRDPQAAGLLGEVAKGTRARMSRLKNDLKQAIRAVALVTLASTLPASAETVEVAP